MEWVHQKSTFSQLSCLFTNTFKTLKRIKSGHSKYKIQLKIARKWTQRGPPLVVEEVNCSVAPRHSGVSALRDRKVAEADFSPPVSTVLTYSSHLAVSLYH